MKKNLTANMTMKIFSLVIAVVIWVLVSGVNDPICTVSYQVKVNVINDSYINDMGKTYQISDEAQMVTVYIKGKKSVVSDRRNLVVEADMTQIVDLQSNPAYIPLQMKPLSGIYSDSVTIMPKTIPVSIEDKASKDFVISVNTTGVPGNGYEVGECTPSSKTILIQGPKSTINKIKSVVATIDVSGITKETEKIVHLVILDKNGDALTDDALSYLQPFNVGNDWNINVNVELWKIMEDIKLIADYSGTVEYGYQVDKITMTPETISVAGSPEALKVLNENQNTIKIPSNLINVDGSNSDIEETIKLSSILREEDGYKIPADSPQSVQIHVSILPFGSKEFKVDTEQIQINGLGKEYRVIFAQDYVTVRIKAEDANLRTLQVSEIKAAIDLKDKKEGEYSVPVNVILPYGYEQVETAVTTVVLEKVTVEKE